MKQHEKVLKMLMKGKVTTKDIFEQWIMCPPKVIETLRKMGYNILTEKVKGQKYCTYTLIQCEPKQMRLC